MPLNPKELENIQIVLAGEQTAPNFALVRMVGCLTPGNGKSWTLTRATDPDVIKSVILIVGSRVKGIALIPQAVVLGPLHARGIANSGRTVIVRRTPLRASARIPALPPVP